jgi:hypothetical protein
VSVYCANNLVTYPLVTRFYTSSNWPRYSNSNSNWVIQFSVFDFLQLIDPFQKAVQSRRKFKGSSGEETREPSGLPFNFFILVCPFEHFVSKRLCLNLLPGSGSFFLLFASVTEPIVLDNFDYNFKSMHSQPLLYITEVTVNF